MPSFVKGVLKRPTFWIALAVVIGTLALWRGFGPSKGAVQWLTEPVTIGNIEDSTTALGRLQPLNYVDVGTQVSGQLTKLHVDLGDEVEKGDLLAEIDPTVLKVKVEGDKGQLESLRAQLTERQAQLVLAQEQFTRQDRMFKANATSKDALDSARTQLKSAQAQIKQIQGSIRQIESSLEGNQANLGYTRILSPLTGMVVSKEARQGQTLNANMSAPIILRVADLDTMTVQAEVSEADVVRLKPGMEVYFSTLGEPNRKWHSTLRQILPTPTVENDVVLYNVLFDVDNKDRALKIEMSAHAFFVHAKAENTLMVPLSALSVAKAHAAQNGQKPQATSNQGPQAGKGEGRPPRLQEAQTEGQAGSREGRKRQGGEQIRVEQILVMESGKPVLRDVRIGVRNRVHVQIIDGVQEGDIVVIGKVDPNAAGNRPAGGGPRRPF